MLSSVPIPSNPWPHDMVLTIENDSQTLLDLLWVREAWSLQPAGEDLAPHCMSSSVRAGVMPSTTMLSRTNSWSGIKLSSRPIQIVATRPRKKNQSGSHSRP